MNQKFLRRPRLHPPIDRSKGKNLDRIAPSHYNQMHVRNSSWKTTFLCIAIYANIPTGQLAVPLTALCET